MNTKHTIAEPIAAESLRTDPRFRRAVVFALAIAAMLMQSTIAVAASIGVGEFSSGTTIEDFEGFVGNNRALVLGSPWVRNGVTYSVTDGDLTLTSINLCHDRTCLQNRTAGVSIDIVFEAPVDMAGLYTGTVAGEWISAVSFFSENNTQIGTLEVTGTDSFTFVGWEAEGAGISRIRVGPNQLNIFSATRIDGLRSFTAVPESSTALLLMLGLAGIGVRRQ